MFTIKRRLLLAVIIVAVGIPATAGGQFAPPQQTQVLASQVQPANPQCPRGYHSLKDYLTYASKVYQRDDVSRSAHLRMAYMRRCQHSPWATSMVRRYHARYKRARAARIAAERAAAAIAAVARYQCSFGRSAIPCYVVWCESKGDWHVVNEIGALGFYQFLGWPVPWPVVTEADKLAHHRMAAKLWADSPSHWAQCL